MLLSKIISYFDVFDGFEIQLALEHIGLGFAILPVCAYLKYVSQVGSQWTEWL